MTYQNPRVRAIQVQAIVKANKMFSPAYNQHTEELTGESNDRTAYDYAGTEQDLITNHN